MTSIQTDQNERCDICRTMYPHDRIESVTLDGHPVRACDKCRYKMESESA